MHQQWPRTTQFGSDDNDVVSDGKRIACAGLHRICALLSGARGANSVEQIDILIINSIIASNKGSIIKFAAVNRSRRDDVPKTYVYILIVYAAARTFIRSVRFVCESIVGFRVLIGTPATVHNRSSCVHRTMHAIHMLQRCRQACVAGRRFCVRFVRKCLFNVCVFFPTSSQWLTRCVYRFRCIQVFRPMPFDPCLIGRGQRVRMCWIVSTKSIFIMDIMVAWSFRNDDVKYDLFLLEIAFGRLFSRKNESDGVRTAYTIHWKTDEKKTL